MFTSFLCNSFSQFRVPDFVNMVLVFRTLYTHYRLMVSRLVNSHKINGDYNNYTIVLAIAPVCSSEANEVIREQKQNLSQ